MTDNIWLNLALIFFVIAPVFDGLVTLFLWRAWRASRNRAVLERLISSVALLGSTAIISLLAIYRLFGLPHLADDVALSALITALSLASVPSLNWLYMYFTDKF